MATAARPPVVDVHSHLYPPLYIDLLRERTEVPCIRKIPDSDDLRLVNREGQTGKPMGPLLYDIATKIAFMDAHKIDISILSLGNPWLDFLPSETAAEVARTINDSTNTLCTTYPGRLYFFATLPLSAPMEDILAEIKRLKTLSHIRGIVLGTGGLGPGLDDPNLLPVFQALADASLPIFLHPHYGLPSSVWGCCADHGQVLPLALGFTMETTIAITRLILADVFTKVPGLKIILAHSGGALPFLAGRIEGCIEHDRKWKAEGRLDTPRQTVWDALKNNLYLDGIVFDKLPLKLAIEAGGVDRVMFGTDHPFFPPLDGGINWPSMTKNMLAVKDVLGEGDDYSMVMGGNAARVLKLA